MSRGVLTFSPFLQHSVCCFSKIRIGCAFLVPAHLGSHGNRAVKRVCVCVCVCVYVYDFKHGIFPLVGVCRLRVRRPADVVLRRGAVRVQLLPARLLSNVQLNVTKLNTLSSSSSCDISRQLAVRWIDEIHYPRDDARRRRCVRDRWTAGEMIFHRARILPNCYPRFTRRL